MTLVEISVSYEMSADLIRDRIRELRIAAQGQTDPEAVRRLEARIAALTPLLRESRDLARLTRHYYDRGYYRNACYTL